MRRASASASSLGGGRATIWTTIRLICSICAVELVPGANGHRGELVDHLLDLLNLFRRTGAWRQWRVRLRKQSYDPVPNVVRAKAMRVENRRGNGFFKQESEQQMLRTDVALFQPVGLLGGV